MVAPTALAHLQNVSQSAAVRNLAPGIEMRSTLLQDVPIPVHVRGHTACSRKRDNLVMTRPCELRSRKQAMARKAACNQCSP
eukprot:CAMPEP_0180821734 /NCGR_PEP_ID=MMETSP1038_2-20121128/70988_1 /TAXON_ID=632150 /ORGANISM="Azadinium spinosum, Strain 3D9" /LENGTH=81 /DNA_ID=CAMNT_0022863935 /DNA_START=347 /DNA_END=589 /DNA_ORIENTATION=+